MENRPVVLMTFASNNLVGVSSESQKLFDVVNKNEDVRVLRLENATILKLTDIVIETTMDLFMFHFGGHSNQHNIVLDGFRSLDKIRLTRLLIPNKNHNLQIIFLNGCLSYGHVGLLTSKGVKLIIATNVNVNDEEAQVLAGYFYNLFFEKKYSIKNAFETAEATVRGKNSYPIIVNPGEIDENQPMPPSWTLFVNSNHIETLNWTLDDFFKKKNT